MRQALQPLDDIGRCGLAGFAPIEEFDQIDILLASLDLGHIALAPIEFQGEFHLREPRLQARLAENLPDCLVAGTI